jgi:hypothetical protein
MHSAHRRAATIDCPCCDGDADLRPASVVSRVAIATEGIKTAFTAVRVDLGELRPRPVQDANLRKTGFLGAAARLAGEASRSR